MTESIANTAPQVKLHWMPNCIEALIRPEIKGLSDKVLIEVDAKHNSDKRRIVSKVSCRQQQTFDVPQNPDVIEYTKPLSVAFFFSLQKCAKP